MNTLKSLAILVVSLFTLNLTGGCEMVAPDPPVFEQGDQSTIGGGGGGGGLGGGGSGGNTGSSYEYTYTCPSGTENSAPIPAGPRQCQQALEYFAEVYGCNLVDSFNEANCRMCDDCGSANYCSLCESSYKIAPAAGPFIPPAEGGCNQSGFILANRVPGLLVGDAVRLF